MYVPYCSWRPHCPAAGVREEGQETPLRFPVSGQTLPQGQNWQFLCKDTHCPGCTIFIHVPPQFDTLKGLCHQFRMGSKGYRWIGLGKDIRL